MDNTVVVIWIIWTVVLLVFFHKIFTVYYFNLGRGLLKELLMAAILGMVMTGLTLYFCQLTVIILILFGIVMAKKTSNSLVFIGCIILAVIIAVMGTRFTKAMKEEKEAESQNIDQLLDAYLENDMSKDSGYPDENEMENTYQGDDLSESNDYPDEDETGDHMAGGKYYDFQDNVVHESDAESSDYILENSDSQYLTRFDLEGLSANDCRLARNELYARHGRKFDSEDLQDYFDSCSWYHGVIEPEDFQESMLNDIETANRDLIVEYEKEMGYR